MTRKDKSIKVRVHMAMFVKDKGQNLHVFVNIANRAKFRTLTVTHIYYEYDTICSTGREKHTIDIIPSPKVLSLPVTLNASECVEIAIPHGFLPHPLNTDSHCSRFVVRTSDGRKYTSERNHTLAEGDVKLLIL